MKWDLPEFHRRQVICIGRGREGLSFQRFIQRHGQPAHFRFVDEADDAAYLDSLRGIDRTTTVVVKTPGCPGRLVPVPYTTPTNVFFDLLRQASVRWIGVTGTKGKSTTTTMIGAILSYAGWNAVGCGNIGFPMLDALDRVPDETLPRTIFVVELSSYQLAEARGRPDIAVITNLYEDHVPYHGTFEAYAEAKRNIVRYTGPTDRIVYHPGFPKVEKWVREAEGQGIPIDPHEALDMRGWKLWGDHNRLNALSAIKAAGCVGVEQGACLTTLRQVPSLPHRLQTVGVVGGVTFIDNAIGGNPAATLAAMQAVRDAGMTIGCLMIGGKDRAYDFCALAAQIVDDAVPNLVCFPDTGRLIKDALPASFHFDCLETDCMQAAVGWAVKHSAKGTVCLLSPASPAQTISADYEMLGHMFAGAVKRWPEKDHFKRVART